MCRRAKQLTSQGRSEKTSFLPPAAGGRSRSPCYLAALGMWQLGRAGRSHKASAEGRIRVPQRGSRPMAAGCSGRALPVCRFEHLADEMQPATFHGVGGSSRGGNRSDSSTRSESRTLPSVVIGQASGHQLLSQWQVLWIGCSRNTPPPPPVEFFSKAVRAKKTGEAGQSDV